MNRKWLIRAGGVLVLLLALGTGRALAAQCTVDATGVRFGSYDRLDGTPLDATGTVTVTCTSGYHEAVAYQIQSSTGTGGKYFPRDLVGNTDTLKYNLYIDAARSLVWGDGSSATSAVVDQYTCTQAAGCSTPRDYTIYGRIPARQNPSPGTYNDTLTVTVMY